MGPKLSTLMLVLVLVSSLVLTTGCGPAPTPATGQDAESTPALAPDPAAARDAALAYLAEAYGDLAGTFKSRTMASTRSPIDISWEGCLIFFIQDISEMCINPSIPSSNSINAP